MASWSWPVPTPWRYTNRTALSILPSGRTACQSSISASPVLRCNQTTGALLWAALPVMETATTASPVARFNKMGQLDTSFNGGEQIIDFFIFNNLDGETNANAASVAVQADGTVVVAGIVQMFDFFFPYFSSSYFTVARLTNTGQLDGSFNSIGLQIIDFFPAIGKQSIYNGGAAVQPDGSVVILAGTDQSDESNCPLDQLGSARRHIRLRRHRRSACWSIL